MKMRGSSVSSALFFRLFALVHVAYSVDYSNLEAEGLSCPSRDKCDRYTNNLTYLDRSCECDFQCGMYKDCCIDARLRNWNDGRSSDRSTAASGMLCMPYGDTPHAGVYAIAHCSNNWNGPAQVREKCEGSEDDFSDPLVAAPVTSVAHTETYRNRYCAECNNAVLSSLTLFNFRMSCYELQDLPVNQLFADLTYNRTLNLWGLNRLNSFSNATQFHGCDIAFDVPSYLNNSVRFCRSNLISSCPQSWTRSYVKRACEEYMAVVFDNLYAYRNPHCAICNGRTVDELSCTRHELSRKRPQSPGIWLDINRNTGDLVGFKEVRTSKCAANQKYDPYHKKCRRLLCALPGYVVANGKCVKG